MPDTLAPPVVEATTDDTDDERHAHIYNRKNPEYVGDKVRTLCGKLATPIADGASLPICPPCLAIHDDIVRAQSTFMNPN